jgi:hypothetical protein
MAAWSRFVRADWRAWARDPVMNRNIGAGLAGGCTLLENFAAEG